MRLTLGERWQFVNLKGSTGDRKSRLARADETRQDSTGHHELVFDLLP